MLVFVQLVHFFFEKLKNDKKQKTCPKNETVFNFFPTPPPPGTLKPFPRASARDGGAVRQIFIPIGPNGAPVRPVRNFLFLVYATPTEDSQEITARNSGRATLLFLTMWGRAFCPVT